MWRSVKNVRRPHVSEKAVHAKAPQRSQTADDYEATDKCQASPGSEAARDG